MSELIEIGGDPFSRAMRQLGDKQEIIEQQAERIARLEELLDSVRSQAEHFMQEREDLKARIDFAMHSLQAII